MFSWAKQQVALVNLHASVAKARKDHAKIIGNAKAAGMPSYEVGQLEYEEYSEMQLLHDQIARIETDRLLSSAYRHSVPIPSMDESDDWEESAQIGGYLLTTAGAMKLRRELAMEKELKQKFFLNWLPIVISVGSFAVSIAALWVSLQSPPA